MGYRYTVSDVAELNSELDRLRAENAKLREALKDCADLLMLGDERGNPNETELEAYNRAYALLKEHPP